MPVKICYTGDSNWLDIWRGAVGHWKKNLPKQRETVTYTQRPGRRGSIESFPIIVRQPRSLIELLRKTLVMDTRRTILQLQLHYIVRASIFYL